MYRVFQNIWFILENIIHNYEDFNHQNNSHQFLQKRNYKVACVIVDWPIIFWYLFFNRIIYLWWGFIGVFRIYKETSNRNSWPFMIWQDTVVNTKKIIMCYKLQQYKINWIRKIKYSSAKIFHGHPIFSTSTQYMGNHI